VSVLAFRGKPTIYDKVLAGNIRLISDLFNVSDSTVVTCRNMVISALGSLKDEYICWPLDAQSQTNVSTKFSEKK
jgi:hypothetical protein